jgi:recombination protein RecT
MNQLQLRETQIKQGLMAQHKVVQSLFGDKVKANKFLATASKVANDYKLANCNVNSIIDACITVAQLNLDLSPALSHAYLVPFKNSVQLIVSARGYTALLARNGWKIKNYIVNEEDEFEYIIDGFEENIKFKKNIDSETETFKYAVALALSPDGTLYIEIMNKNQIEKHRLKSSNQKAKPSGIWLEWYNEMASKTVIKKLVKKLPMGEDIASVVQADDKPMEAEVINDTPQVDLNAMVTQQPQEDENIDATTGEVTSEPQKSSCSFAYTEFLQRGIKRSDLVKFCEFLNLPSQDELQMLLDDAELFEIKKGEFYNG